jgi:hypothetical protein
MSADSLHGRVESIDTRINRLARDDAVEAGLGLATMVSVIQTEA